MGDTLPSYAQEIAGNRWIARQRLNDGGLLADQVPDDPAAAAATWPAVLDLHESTSDNPGLRRPQIGAVHALLGYWTTDPKVPATIVMPTGTGKTDSMVATLVAARIEKLLVIVPSDALREQIAERFETLGALRTTGLIDPDASNPVVARLRGALASIDDADLLLGCINVVVATPSALESSEPVVRKHFLDGFTHLFIDEAHHVGAPTWRAIRDAFLPRPVVQFTATPHRTDGQHLGGSMVYVFPLREAQRAGYFSTIGYLPILDLLDPDTAVATAAVTTLRADLADGNDHILMARANTINRAERIAEIYQTLAPEFAPVFVHNRTKKAQRLAAVAALRDRSSRILVCVDMFGEGFDLPQLKIAALHDQHRSLGITLQFVGRFARGGVKGLGRATVVAAQTDYRHVDTLRRLYAEDADWDLIIEDLSRAAVEDEVELDEFLKAFNHDPDPISIHSVTPAMSTVVYRSPSLTWSPTNLYEMYDESELLTFPIPISERDHVAWYVTQQRAPVRWGTIEGTNSIQHDLYVIYWDAERGLLYINSSNNDGVHGAIAEALTGSDASLIAGENIYRVFHGVERLTPTNVGLLDTRSRARRYTSYTGADVTEGFPTAERQTKAQTHIAGSGFVGGAPHSIAGSRKGRVWSHRTAAGIREWTVWCDEVGTKLLDETISVDTLIAGFIKPQPISSWPTLTALAVEPTAALGDALAHSILRYDDVDVPWSSVELEIRPQIPSGSIELTLRTDAWEARFLLQLQASGMSCVAIEEDVVVRRERSDTTFSAIATKRGLLVDFEGDAVVEPPGILLKPDRSIAPFVFSDGAITDWTEVNIRKESWGATRDRHTVQGRMAEITESGDWDLIIDDDGPGEIADLVALREIDGALVVRLIHCKYSHEDSPGARIEDLYEVCGQAMKSARWRRDPEGLLRRLLQRERDRLQKLKPTGFIRGTIAELNNLIQRSPRLQPRYTIAIAQPGLSAGRVSAAQLELLASVEVYCSEIASAEFVVHCSA